MIEIEMTEEEARAVSAAVKRQRDRVGKVFSEMRSMGGSVEDASDLFDRLERVHRDLKEQING